MAYTSLLNWTPQITLSCGNEVADILGDDRRLDVEEEMHRANLQTPACLELQQEVHSRIQPLKHGSHRRSRFVAKALYVSYPVLSIYLNVLIWLKICFWNHRSEKQLINRSQVGNKVKITAGSFVGLATNQITPDVLTKSIEEFRLVEAEHVRLWDRKKNVLIRAFPLVSTYSRATLVTGQHCLHPNIKYALFVQHSCTTLGGSLCSEHLTVVARV